MCFVMSGVLPDYFSIFSGILIWAVPVLLLYSYSATTSLSMYPSLFIPLFCFSAFLCSSRGGRLSPEQQHASLLQHRWRSQRVYVFKGLSCGSRAGRSHWHPAFDPLRVLRECSGFRQVCICVGIIELWLTDSKKVNGVTVLCSSTLGQSDLSIQICNSQCSKD